MLAWFAPPGELKARGIMEFRRADRERVARGEITVTFRLWRSPQVKAGKTYRSADGAIEIESLEVIPAKLIADEDVARSGCGDLRDIWELAGEHTRSIVGPETLLHRVQFRYLGAGPPHAEQTAPPEPARLRNRLERMDRLSGRGPWTLAVLRLIASAPGVPARLLAADLGWETSAFKARVRRLKALGLTISREVGYELSDLGHGYLDEVDSRAAGS